MKLIRTVLWVVGIVAVIVVIGLVIASVWLDSFIRSDAFRHDVEARVSQTLGATVEIKQIDFDLLHGVQLDGLALKMVTAQGTVLTQVVSVKCDYSLSALLHRKLQVDGITVMNPSTVLTQVEPSRVHLPQPPAVPTAKIPSPETSKSGKTLPFDVIIKAAKIKNGSLSLQDSTGATKADLEGFEVISDTGGYFEGKDVTGTLTIAKIVLPQNLGATDFTSSFRYRTDLFEASSYQVSAFGGQVTGDYTLEGDNPSVLEVDATKIDLAQAEQAAAPHQPAKLTGVVAFQSKWTSIETGTLTGEGDAQIANGKLEGVHLLHDLAKAFQLPEMSDPDLKNVNVHYRVAGGVTHFSGLQIKSTVFEMAGSGTVDPQGNLSANMTLTLHADAMQRIPRYSVPFFTNNLDGSATVPFQLSGTVDDPQSDSLTRSLIQSSKVKESIEKTFDKLFH